MKLLFLALLLLLHEVSADFNYDEQYFDSAPRNGSRFGTTVSVTNEIVVVGSPRDQAGAADVNGGSVSFFNVFGGFEPLSEIVHPDPSESGAFGKSLSIGERNLAVGANRDGDGIVYMYRYEILGIEVNVTLVERIFVTDETLDLANFGSSVSLFDVTEIGAPEAMIGATLAVGAPAEVDATNVGVVFVYYAADALNPVWQQQDRIAPSDVTVVLFGQTVSLYTDALAVSGVTVTGGVVFIYNRTVDMKWVEVAELRPTVSAPGDGFGSSLSLRFELLKSGYEVLSLAVGAPNANAAYIMIYDPRRLAWSQNAKLTAPSSVAPGDQFGYSVALYERYAVVGAKNAGGKGSITTYEARNESNRVAWFEMSTTTPATATANAEFGYSLYLSGTNLIVGAPGYDNDIGSAYLYTLFTTSSSPSLSPTDVPTSAPSSFVSRSPTVPVDFYPDETYRDGAPRNGSRFGTTVSIANEIIVVGAPRDKVGNLDVNGGSVSFFDIFGGFEPLSEIVHPDPSESGAFGKSLSIGERNLAVGANRDGDGIVYMYRYEILGIEVNVTLVERIFVTDETLDLANFGSSVSLFDVTEIGAPEAMIGATLAVGAPAEVDSTNDGVVFVYFATDALNPVWQQQDRILPPDASVVRFGQTVSLYTDALAVSGVTLTGGVVFIYNRTVDMKWAQVAELRPTVSAAGDGFGSSLSLRFELLNSGYEVLSLAVGAPNTNSAYIMIYDPRRLAWSQNAKLTTPAAAVGEFGYSVGLYERYAVVGSRSAGGRGCVTTYSARNESNRVVWDVLSTSTPESVTIDSEFGYSVSIAGTHFVVGAPGFEDDAGAAYLYSMSSTPAPSKAPTAELSFAPSRAPSRAPTSAPSAGAGSSAPTHAPTRSPTIPVDFYPDETYQDETPISGSRFGTSVSIANEVIVVGAPRDITGTSGINAGSVSIFDVYNGFEPILELPHPDPNIAGSFGRAVSIGEKNLAVGGILNEKGVVYTYMYEFDDGDLNVTLVQRIVPAMYDEPFFGASVSLFDTTVVGTPEATVGATLAVGAPADPEGQDPTSVGAVFVYYAPDASLPVWAQQAVLFPSVSSKEFGRTVSLFSNALAVGASNANGGVVYIFNRTDSMVWMEAAQLAASTSSADFGFSLSLRYYLIQNKYEVLGLAVGAPASEAVYVMIYDPRVGQWSQNAKLSAPAAAVGEFGYSVGLYEKYIAVGSRSAAGGGSLTTYQARNESNRVAWQLLSTSTPDGVDAGSEFGFSVALNGLHIVAGAPGYRNGEGSAYLYSQSSTAAPSRMPSQRPTDADSADESATDDWSLESYDSAAILLTVLLIAGVVAAGTGYLLYRHRRQDDLKKHLLFEENYTEREPTTFNKL